MEFQIEMFSPPKKQGIYIFFLHIMYPSCTLLLCPATPALPSWSQRKHRNKQEAIISWCIELGNPAFCDNHYKTHKDLLSLLSLMYLFPYVRNIPLYCFFVNIDSPLTCSFTCFNRATHYSSCEALMASEI